ncbi:hypothetical protein LCGC14_2904210 [marine sediment metagenome]|uniref:Uncharacterized protein n=1 Tax=marine sediment metagenome TaxID=412755 RepID=A0A0F9AJR9_9ZZZZ
MPTASNKGGSDYELIPEGLEIGVCYAVIDLGTRYDEKFKKDKREVCLIWELPDVEPIIIDDKPMPRVISKRYTLSLDERANLRHDLESWRGTEFTEEQLEGFNLDVLPEVNCQIQVFHKKSGAKTYANIKTIIPVPKGHVTIKPVNKTVVYDILDVVPDDGSIPEWICGIIRDAKEWDAEPETDKPSEVPEEESDVEPF